MRWILLALLGCWVLLTVFAYSVVLPEPGRDEDLIAAYLVVADRLEARAPDAGGRPEGLGEGAGGAATGESDLRHASAAQPTSHRVFWDVIRAYRQRLAASGLEVGPAAGSASGDRSYLEDTQALTPGGLARILDFPASERARSFELFRQAYQEVTGHPLRDAPVLVWSTDDNPARRVQTQLFREWHLEHYGTPVDIVTDPSNRDVTKTIVQSTAGAGPDLIEAYGPAELGQFIDAGIALEVTERAQADGFGIETVFAAARSSIARQRPDGTWAQYAFPCNVGYTVLFYHKDLIEQAGAVVPEGPWTLAEAIELASRLTSGTDGARRRVGIMNMSAWDMALAAGATFLNEDGTASAFNCPQAVEAFRIYQAMMYEHRVMPSPAEAASMAGTGGAGMNADAESVSASSLFAIKATAMAVGGRWEYVALAQRNRDRVIVPAIDRRLRELSRDGSADAQAEAALLASARALLVRDVLLPLSEAQHAAVARTLTPDDRAMLIQLGVAHVPTLSGRPHYSAAARVAIVNRAAPRAEEAQRFLRFLASEAYNRRINNTFDSICGVPAFCMRTWTDPERGEERFEATIDGPPIALPGLEAFDSPVFVEAMAQYARPWQLSPFIGRNRLGMLVEQVIERLTNNEIGPAQAAQLIEDRLNAQIMANLQRDHTLRQRWEAMVGAPLDPSQNLRAQAERSRSTGAGAGSSSAAGGGAPRARRGAA
jgi:ABC-type glycerol-3-phosphate transport system substrate-binding protein